MCELEKEIFGGSESYFHKEYAQGWGNQTEYFSVRPQYASSPLLLTGMLILLISSKFVSSAKKTITVVAQIIANE